MQERPCNFYKINDLFHSRLVAFVKQHKSVAFMQVLKKYFSGFKNSLMAL